MILANKVLRGSRGDFDITSPNHPNLAAFYTMDNISGATLFDETSNSNDGTIVGAVFDAGGIIDGALLFDGINDRVDTPHSASLDVGELGEDYSVAVWFNTSMTIGGTLTAKFDATASSTQGILPFLIDLGIDNGKVRVVYRGTPGVAKNVLSVNTYNDGAWHFVSASRDQSTFKFTLRIDDSEDILGDADVTEDISNTATVTLGYVNNDGAPISFFDGKLDQYRLFKGLALSAADHAELFNETAPVIPITASNHPNLKAMYTMDNISGSTLIDETANNHDATLVNSPTVVTGIISDALSFDGVDQRATLMPISSLGVTPQATGISFWFKAIQGDLTGNNVTIRSDLPGTLKASEHLLTGLQPDGSMITRSNNTNLFSSVGRLDDNTWHHVVSNRTSGNRIEQYIDGVSQGSIAVPAVTAGFNLGIAIASNTFPANDTYHQFFQGSIDQVRYFNRILTQEEVTALFEE